MKVRISGNSIRLRLKPSEVEQLECEGSVRDEVDFGGGSILAYTLAVSPDATAPTATLRGSNIEVAIPQAAARRWFSSDQVSIEGEQNALSISVEKDFRCLHKDDTEADAYPNPLQLQD